MYCIVPLAGPDFYNEKYGYKPLYNIDGTTLIEETLLSRSWYKNKELSNEKIIFVLKDEIKHKEFEDYIKDKFNGCKVVKISDYTRGALLSAMAGASLISDFNEPIVVDLVDMIYEADFSPINIFKKNLNIGGIIPYFKSTNEKYSYLEIVDGYVNQTVEKKVISNNASVGTYFFRNLNIFLQAASGSVKMDKVIGYNNNLFVCPSYNSINMFSIYSVEVYKCKELSLIFH